MCYEPPTKSGSVDDLLIQMKHLDPTGFTKFLINTLKTIETYLKKARTNGTPDITALECISTEFLKRSVQLHNRHTTNVPLRLEMEQRDDSY